MGLLNWFLNVLLVLAGAFQWLLVRDRNAYWGPEGPVGGGLLLIPPVLLMLVVLAGIILTGKLDGVPGGRPLCAFLLVGLLITEGAACFYAAERSQTAWQTFVVIMGWLILTGCFIAVNFGWGATSAKIAIAGSLGLTSLLGWGLAAAGVAGHLENVQKLEASKVESAKEFQQAQALEFRALGKSAPLWQYFSYLYMEDDALRTECRELVAGRPDLDESLVSYLVSPILSHDADRYIWKLHPNPGARLAPAFARQAAQELDEFRELMREKSELSDHLRTIAQTVLGAGVRIQQGGGDVSQELSRWREFLASLRHNEDLIAEIDRVVPRR